MPSNVTRSTASGTTPSHPTSSHLEALIPRRILGGEAALHLGGRLEGEHGVSSAANGGTLLRQGQDQDPRRHTGAGAGGRSGNGYASQGAVARRSRCAGRRG